MRGMVKGLALAVLLSAYLPAAPAQADAAGEAASACHGLYEGLTSPSLLADNRNNAQLKIRRCIVLGVDPPIKARKEGGTRPAADVSAARISSDTCPPFSPCLTIARSSAQNINEENEGGAGGAPPPTRYSAPQFSGHLPEQWPDALKNGGTIYFYGSVKVTPPDGSLIYPRDSQNYYADGATVTVKDAHIALAPAPNGEILRGKYAVLNQDAKFNFDDGGIAVLPRGFNGIIKGQNVTEGDVIVINHAGNLRMPKGTRLYPFPSGSHPNGAHVGGENYKPYAGPEIVLPENPKLVINDTIDHCAPECDEPDPGEQWF